MVFKLIWDLLPIMFGLIASPLAVLALLAVLFSRRPRLNGLMYLLGWSAAVIAVTVVSYLVFNGLAPNSEAHSWRWVAITRLVLGTVMFIGAWYTYSRSPRKLAHMFAAVTPQDVLDSIPQLPPWYQQIDKFNPTRSVQLGAGIFLFNPINVSCAIAAPLEIELAHVPAGPSAIVLAWFLVLCIVPMALPVFWHFKDRNRAEPGLLKLRAWIVVHNGTLGAVFLAMTAFGQYRNAIELLA
ncbi:MAG: GAP family protein [Glutamicibacter protophormiae]